MRTRASTRAYVCEAGGQGARCAFQVLLPLMEFRSPFSCTTDCLAARAFVLMGCNGACFGGSPGVRAALIRGQSLICRSMPWHARLAPLPNPPFVSYRRLLMPDGHGNANSLAHSLPPFCPSFNCSLCRWVGPGVCALHSDEGLPRHVGRAQSESCRD